MSNSPARFPLEVLRGNHGECAVGPEPARESECPPPPSFLSRYGAEEWGRVAPQLWRIGLLRVTDVIPLAAYCAAYSRWRTAEETAARLAEEDTAPGALTTSGRDGPRANPLMRIAAHAARDMIKFAVDFRLIPVARSRLAAGIHGQPPAAESSTACSADGRDACSQAHSGR